MTEVSKKNLETDKSELFVVQANADALIEPVDEAEWLEKAFKEYHDISDSEDSESTVSYKSEEKLWHDPEDEENYIDIQEFQKLRKLKKYQNEVEDTVVSASNLQRLLKKFKNSKLNSSDWVSKLKKKSAEESINRSKKIKLSEGVDSLLHSSTKLINSTNTHLPSENLHYKTLPDANHFNHFQSCVTICSFVPGTKLFIAAARDNSLNIYKNAGHKNTKLIKSIDFSRRNIKAAIPNNEAYISGICGKHSLYKYNIETGSMDITESLQINKTYNTLHGYAIAPNDSNLHAVLADQGYTLLLDKRTNQIVQKYKMNNFGRAITFSSSSYSYGVCLYTGDESGYIYEWDTRKKGCFRRIKDEGSTCVTSISLSPFDHFLAVGSKTGYVNLYDVRRINSNLQMSSVFKQQAVEQPTQENFKLIKAIGNLTTIVTQVKFHPSNQILGMISSFAPEAIKLTHLHSLTTFKNFPRQDKSMKYPTVFDFNDFGDLLLVGTSHGVIKTYSLPYFSKEGSNQKTKLSKFVASQFY